MPQLESALQALMNEMNELKNKPPLYVERIEYKFNQLQVETLDGTLNIGLNPNDLRQLDEFTVNGAHRAAPYLFPDRDAMIQDISHNIYGEMDEMIAESEANTGIPVDPSYRQEPIPRRNPLSAIIRTK